jgi:trehalose synthase-fused probable maltokinase
MSDRVVALLQSPEFQEWFVSQRWYAAKSRTLSGIDVLDTARLDDGIEFAIVGARFTTGRHELYQALIGPDSSSFDALTDVASALALGQLIDSGADIESAGGTLAFRRAAANPGFEQGVAVRPVGVEQTNTSVVFGERLILKVFRRLEPGINPELEILRFLEAQSFANIAPLHGWYEYEGQVLAATLGVVQEFLADAVGGWELALREVGPRPEAFLARLAALGEVTAEMHKTLASDPGDPAFSPEEPSHEWISLLTATIDEEIEQIWLGLPQDERLAPIAGRGDHVRERLAHRTQIGLTGRMIRTHGDYHLGQTLDTSRGWIVVDFEGEPARPLSERRRKRSALRDVAGMLRSFAYIASAASERSIDPPPPDFEQRAREAFLGAYLDTIDRTLLPAGESATMNLLAIFELERAIYELRYELDHRPDWVSTPVVGILRLLESV